MPYAPVNGVDMYYEVHGEGRPTLLLHGAYQTVDSIGPLLPGLAETRQVIASDARGHGRTALGDREMTYGLLGEDAAALLHHLGIEHADVIGYSMGGAAATELAIRHPGLVRRLVVASSSFRADAEAVPAEALAMFPTITPEVFKGTPMEEEYLRLAPHPEDFPKLVEGIKGLDEGFAIPDEDIRGIAAPTLIVLGDSDVITLDHAVHFFRLRGGGVMGDLSGMPESQLAVLPGTSHFIPPGCGLLDRTEWLLSMITTFLDRSPSAGEAGSPEPV
jgi:pimeloyl-ACP methyl ester carboxylesterase